MGAEPMVIDDDDDEPRQVSTIVARGMCVCVCVSMMVAGFH